MQILKSGKEEIVYLLTKVIEKYRSETGQEIVQNTNRKNYEVLAIVLSEISNQLPSRWQELGTEAYQEEYNKQTKEYPYRKYDITGGQIKDALNGIVANPRHFLVDACYIYLYGIGRKAFEQNPLDENLLESFEKSQKEKKVLIEQENGELRRQVLYLEEQSRKYKSKKKALISIAVALLITIVYLITNYYSLKDNWQTIKSDMNILPYQPNKAEIDSLEGVWMCYIGSPQARISDPNRYHKYVSNLINVTYKNGYFTFNRYGASFNHVGYMQFESPGIVSVFSKIKNNSKNIESPRHSLFNLYANNKFVPVISSSWNFDVGDKNRIIGIREVYIKLGKGGAIEEIINEVENASCNCKVIRWHQSNNKVKSFYLKNGILDSIQNTDLKNLINETSILLSTNQDGLLLSTDTTKKQ